MQAESKQGNGGKGTVIFVLTLLVVSAVVGALAIFSGRQVQTTTTTVSSVVATPQGLNSFPSYSALQAFIATNSKSAQNYDSVGGGAFIGGPMVGRGVFAGGVANGNVPAVQGAASSLATQATPSFTTTNVQVQGVDEPDIVKTDGTHLFVATNGGTGSPRPVGGFGGGVMIRPYPGSQANGSVTIINAYPPTSTSVLSTISLSGATVLGLEVASNRLVVIDQKYTNTTYVGLLLFDTTNLSSPKLIQNQTLAGSYVAARLAQGYLYAIIQQPTYRFDNQGNATGLMPYVISDGAKTALPPTSIYYAPIHVQISEYTLVVSLSLNSGTPSTLSVMTGPSSTVYVSTSNIYVVYANYPEYANADGIPGDLFTGGVISPRAIQMGENSTIFRATYSNGAVAVQAVGSVPGSVLNQFSMNEYNGHFMVATSRSAIVQGNATRSDDVYVLDQSMNQVSALQNIAPGENIYAVRFVGDMGYVVTFEQIDPLFAISFADVTHPVILSALKVNGYSDYLQQLFPGYLIGVGKDTVPASNGNFAYYLGLKLSLFHIASDGTSSDVQDYFIGDRGTDSPALTDHLAFTWDQTRNVTVIPVLLYKVSATHSPNPGSIPPYGSPVWQGAYVIHVDATGFKMLGNVSQYPAGKNYGDSPNNNLQIQRTVIIGNFLYTISSQEVMVSDLSSFATVGTVALP